MAVTPTTSTDNHQNNRKSGTSGVKYHSFAFREEIAVQISAKFTDTSSTSTATLASPGR
jgi:hypothetical protein